MKYGTYCYVVIMCQVYKSSVKFNANTTLFKKSRKSIDYVGNGNFTECPTLGIPNSGKTQRLEYPIEKLGIPGKIAGIANYWKTQQWNVI